MVSIAALSTALVSGIGIAALAWSLPWLWLVTNLLRPSARTRPSNRSQEIVLVGYTALLWITSALVILKGASDEPYSTFRRADVFIQVGLGSALAALWLHLIAHVSFGIARRKLLKTLIPVLLLGAVNLYMLFLGATGYISDLETFGPLRTLSR